MFGFRPPGWMLSALAVALFLTGPVSADDLADLQANLADGARAEERGDYETALARYKVVLPLATKLLGAESDATLQLRLHMGNCHYFAGRYKLALQIYSELLKTQERLHGPTALELADPLLGIANSQHGLQRLDEYQKATERYLKIYEARLAPDDPKIADALITTARCYREQGEFAKALPLYERAVKIREAKLGEKDPEYARALIALGTVYYDLARYRDAQAVELRCLKLQAAILPATHLDIAFVCENLASAYMNTGECDLAEPLLERALKIRELNQGADHADVAHTWQYLAALYSRTNESDKCEAALRRGAAIVERQLGAAHPSYAYAIGGLATVYRNQGRYADALPLLRRAVQITERAYGGNHFEVGRQLDSLAELYVAMGQRDEAIKLAQRSVAIHEATVGREHPYVAQALVNLANLYRAQEQFDLARPLVARALAIRETLGNPRDIVDCLVGLGDVDSARHKFADAEQQYRRALRLAREAKFPDKSAEAACVNALGRLAMRTDRAADAENLLREANALLEQALGPNHPFLAEVGYSNLALVYAASDKPQPALAAFDRARRIVRHHAASVLPALTAQEQLSFLENTDRRQFYSALSFALAQRESQPIVDRSAEWLLNGKAVAQETLAEQAWQVRDRANPALAAQSRRLAGVRSQLAQLTLASSKSADAAVRDLVDDLARQERELTRELLAGAARPATESQWADLTALRKGLPADAVFIDIARFDQLRFVFGPEQAWQPARYAAWVTLADGQGATKLVDLGPAEPIDAAVNEFKAQMQAAPRALQQTGEPAGEKQLLTSLAAIDKLVLDPLLPAIGAARELVISPDAALWLVPWSALPTTVDGKAGYAIERWNIRFAVSGRDVLRDGAEGSANPPRIFANPDYDLPPNEAAVVLDNTLRGLGAQNPQSLRATPANAALTRVMRAGGALGQVSQLPGTEAEARGVAPRLAKYAGAEPKLYLDKQAQEGIFKRLRSPSVLVLATHGFFLPDQLAATDSDNSTAAASTDPDAAAPSAYENPLLRCGLLLAGCNRRGQSVVGQALDDGILTGMEVVAVDLRGTQLVVLSACETGLGDVQNSEGVAGLRQAFQLAGARCVVASLWQIPDRATAELMNDFFANLAAKSPKGEALRHAQLAMIKSRRDKFGAAHPLYWAAFTVTGE